MVRRGATLSGNEGAGTHSKIGSMIHSSRFLRDVHYGAKDLRRVGSGVWGSRGDAV